MQTAIRTRFAPSPTGYMHLGNIWVAFLNCVSKTSTGSEATRNT